MRNHGLRTHSPLFIVLTPHSSSLLTSTALRETLSRLRSPEYVSWSADPALLQEFGKTIERDPARRDLIATLPREAFLLLYERLLLRSAAGHRSVAVGSAGCDLEGLAGAPEKRPPPSVPSSPWIRRFDYVAPMIRNQSACGDMGMPIGDVFRGYLAAANGPSRGRDLHIGSMPHHVIPPISPVGVMVPVCVGSLWPRRCEARQVSPSPGSADGSAKAGVAHEGLNFAAVQRAPVIFIIQNNQVALRNPSGSAPCRPRASRAGLALTGWRAGPSMATTCSMPLPRPDSPVEVLPSR